MVHQTVVYAPETIQDQIARKEDVILHIPVIIMELALEILIALALLMTQTDFGQDLFVTSVKLDIMAVTVKFLVMPIQNATAKELVLSMEHALALPTTMMAIS